MSQNRKKRSLKREHSRKTIPQDVISIHMNLRIGNHPYTIEGRDGVVAERLGELLREKGSPSDIDKFMRRFMGDTPGETEREREGRV